MGGLGPAAAAAAVEASELPRGTCFSGALSKQVLADCGHIPGLYGSPRYTTVQGRWSERPLLGFSSCTQPILGWAGSRELQLDLLLPIYLDVGMLCPWVRSEGESESSVTACFSTIHLGRDPQRSSSLSLPSPMESPRRLEGWQDAGTVW